MLSDSLIILDNVKNSAKIVVNVEVKKNANLEKIYNSSIKKINDIEKKIKQNSKITNRLSSNSLSKKNKIIVRDMKSYNLQNFFRVSIVRDSHMKKFLKVLKSYLDN